MRHDPLQSRGRVHVIKRVGKKRETTDVLIKEVGTKERGMVVPRSGVLLQERCNHSQHAPNNATQLTVSGIQLVKVVFAYSA